MASRIFLSHSQEDESAAEPLVAAIESMLPGVPITCTSVPGYGLDAGERISDAIQARMNESTAVFALLTPRSLRSDWVMFELGACWANSRQQLVAILGPGLSYAQLPQPLRDLFCLLITDKQAAGQIRQALQKTAERMGIEPNPSERTFQKIEVFVAAFRATDILSEGEATEYEFVCTDADALEAKQVHVAGSFNEWLNNRNGTIVPDDRYSMELAVVDGKPVRRRRIRIALGPNNFKFVTGSNQWISWTEGCGFERGTDAPGGPNCRVVGIASGEPAAKDPD